MVSTSPRQRSRAPGRGRSGSARPATFLASGRRRGRNRRSPTRTRLPTAPLPVSLVPVKTQRDIGEAYFEVWRQGALEFSPGRAPFPHPPRIPFSSLFLHFARRIPGSLVPFLVVVALHDRRTEARLDERDAGEVPGEPGGWDHNGRTGGRCHALEHLALSCGCALGVQQSGPRRRDRLGWGLKVEEEPRLVVRLTMQLRAIEHKPASI